MIRLGRAARVIYGLAAVLVVVSALALLSRRETRSQDTVTTRASLEGSLHPQSFLLLSPVYLLLAVVAHQRFRMHRYQQSSWKGGGFGMFADIGTSAVTAVLSTRDATGAAAELRLHPRDAQSLFNVVPSEANLRRFAGDVLQGRWSRCGDRVVPHYPDDTSPPLSVSRVTLKRFKTDFDRRTGTYSASLEKVLTVDR